MNSDTDHMYLEAVATFFSHGNYYAFYNDANATYYSHSQDGRAWTPPERIAATANTAVAFDSNTSTVYVASIPNGTNEIILASGRTETTSGAVNWTGAPQVIYNASVSGVKLLGLILDPSTSLTVDNSGNLWVTLQTLFFQMGEQFGYPFVNYTVLKIVVFPGASSNHTPQIASGFPRVIGGQTSHNYDTSSVQIVPNNLGVTVAACNVNSPLTNASAYVQSYYNENSTWGDVLDLPFKCGYNFNGEISTIVAASSGSSSSSGADNISILYFSAALACNSCEYTNTNITRIVSPISKGSTPAEEDLVDGNISGGFIGTAVGGYFVFTNSQVFGAYSGANTYYVGELGSAKTTSGILLRLGGAWSIVGSSSTEGPSGGLPILYSVLTNATAGSQGAYSLGFALAFPGR